MPRYHHGGHADESRARGRGGRGHAAFGGSFGPRVHGDFAGWGGPGRARRGDVRLAVLRLLAESPMHGYQIIQELAERSGGAWRPSPGSVYPTLQLLEDEGLLVSHEDAGKRVFGITEAGRTAAAETADAPAPWDEAARTESGMELREAGGRLIAAVRQVAHTANEDQRARAVAVLSDARKKLYAILAED